MSERKRIQIHKVRDPATQSALRQVETALNELFAAPINPTVVTGVAPAASTLGQVVAVLAALGLIINDTTES